MKSSPPMYTIKVPQLEMKHSGCTITRRVCADQVRTKQPPMVGTLVARTTLRDA